MSIQLPIKFVHALRECTTNSFLSSTSFFDLIDSTLSQADSAEDDISLDLTAFLPSSFYVSPFLQVIHGTQFGTRDLPPLSIPLSEVPSLSTTTTTSSYHCYFLRNTEYKPKLIVLRPSCIHFSSSLNRKSRGTSYNNLRVLSFDERSLEFVLPIPNQSVPFTFKSDQNQSKLIKSVLVSAHNRYCYFSQRLCEAFPKLELLFESGFKITKKTKFVYISFLQILANSSIVSLKLIALARLFEYYPCSILKNFNFQEQFEEFSSLLSSIPCKGYSQLSEQLLGLVNKKMDEKVKFKFDDVQGANFGKLQSLSKSSVNRALSQIINEIFDSGSSNSRVLSLRSFNFGSLSKFLGYFANNYNLELISRLSLVNCGFKDNFSLSLVRNSFSNIQILELDHNELRKLSGQPPDTLFKISVLGNQFSDVNSILEPFKNGNSNLKELFVVGNPFVNSQSSLTWFFSAVVPIMSFKLSINVIDGFPVNNILESLSFLRLSDHVNFLTFISQLILPDPVVASKPLEYGVFALNNSIISPISFVLSGIIDLLVILVIDFKSPLFVSSKAMLTLVSIARDEMTLSHVISSILVTLGQKSSFLTSDLGILLTIFDSVFALTCRLTDEGRVLVSNYINLELTSLEFNSFQLILDLFITNNVHQLYSFFGICKFLNTSLNISKIPKFFYAKVEANDNLVEHVYAFFLFLSSTQPSFSEEELVIILDLCLKVSGFNTFLPPSLSLDCDRPETLIMMMLASILLENISISNGKVQQLLEQILPLSLHLLTNDCHVCYESCISLFSALTKFHGQFGVDLCCGLFSDVQLGDISILISILNNHDLIEPSVIGVCLSSVNSLVQKLNFSIEFSNSLANQNLLEALLSIISHAKDSLASSALECLMTLLSNTPAIQIETSESGDLKVFLDNLIVIIKESMFKNCLFDGCCKILSSLSKIFDPELLFEPFSAPDFVDCLTPLISNSSDHVISQLLSFYVIIYGSREDQPVPISLLKSFLNHFHNHFLIENLINIVNIALFQPNQDFILYCETLINMFSDFIASKCSNHLFKQSHERLLSCLLVTLTKLVVCYFNHHSRFPKNISSYRELIQSLYSLSTSSPVSPSVCGIDDVMRVSGVLLLIFCCAGNFCCVFPPDSEEFVSFFSKILNEIQILVFSNFEEDLANDPLFLKEISLNVFNQLISQDFVLSKISSIGIEIIFSLCITLSRKKLDPLNTYSVFAVTLLAKFGESYVKSDGIELDGSDLTDFFTTLVCGLSMDNYNLPLETILEPIAQLSRLVFAVKFLANESTINHLVSLLISLLNDWFYCTSQSLYSCIQSVLMEMISNIDCHDVATGKKEVDFRNVAFIIEILSNILSSAPTHVCDLILSLPDFRKFLLNLDHFSPNFPYLSEIISFLNSLFTLKVNSKFPLFPYVASLLGLINQAFLGETSQSKTKSLLDCICLLAQKHPIHVINSTFLIEKLIDFVENPIDDQILVSTCDIFASLAKCVIPFVNNKLQSLPFKALLLQLISSFESVEVLESLLSLSHSLVKNVKLFANELIAEKYHSSVFNLLRGNQLPDGVVSIIFDLCSELLISDAQLASFFNNSDNLLLLIQFSQSSRLLLLLFHQQHSLGLSNELFKIFRNCLEHLNFQVIMFFLQVYLRFLKSSPLNHNPNSFIPIIIDCSRHHDLLLICLEVMVQFFDLSDVKLDVSQIVSVATKFSSEISTLSSSCQSNLILLNSKLISLNTSCFSENFVTTFSKNLLALSPEENLVLHTFNWLSSVSRLFPKSVLKLVFNYFSSLFNLDESSATRREFHFGSILSCLISILSSSVVEDDLISKYSKKFVEHPQSAEILILEARNSVIALKLINFSYLLSKYTDLAPILPQLVHVCNFLLSNSRSNINYSFQAAKFLNDVVIGKNENMAELTLTSSILVTVICELIEIVKSIFQSDPTKLSPGLSRSLLLFSQILGNLSSSHSASCSLMIDSLLVHLNHLDQSFVIPILIALFKISESCQSCRELLAIKINILMTTLSQILDDLPIEVLLSSIRVLSHMISHGNGLRSFVVSDVDMLVDIFDRLNSHLTSDRDQIVDLFDCFISIFCHLYSAYPTKMKTTKFISFVFSCFFQNCSFELYSDNSNVITLAGSYFNILNKFLDSDPGLGLIFSQILHENSELLACLLPIFSIDTLTIPFSKFVSSVLASNFGLKTLMISLLNEFLRKEETNVDLIIHNALQFLNISNILDNSLLCKEMILILSTSCHQMSRDQILIFSQIIDNCNCLDVFSSGLPVQFSNVFESSLSDLLATVDLEGQNIEILVEFSCLFKIIAYAFSKNSVTKSKFFNNNVNVLESTLKNLVIKLEANSQFSNMFFDSLLIFIHLFPDNELIFQPEYRLKMVNCGENFHLLDDLFVSVLNSFNPNFNDLLDFLLQNACFLSNLRVKSFVGIIEVFSQNFAMLDWTQFSCQLLKQFFVKFLVKFEIFDAKTQQLAFEFLFKIFDQISALMSGIFDFSIIHLIVSKFSNIHHYVQFIELCLRHEFFDPLKIDLLWTQFSCQLSSAENLDTIQSLLESLYEVRHNLLLLPFIRVVLSVFDQSKDWSFPITVIASSLEEEDFKLDDLVNTDHLYEFINYCFKDPLKSTSSSFVLKDMCSILSNCQSAFCICNCFESYLLTSFFDLCNGESICFAIEFTFYLSNFTDLSQQSSLNLVSVNRLITSFLENVLIKPENFFNFVHCVQFSLKILFNLSDFVPVLPSSTIQNGLISFIEKNYNKLNIDFVSDVCNFAKIDSRFTVNLTNTLMNLID
ncbi:hypothetical protein P9112_014028 [Eukaryota sp. TZLM1-RC]